MATQWPRLLPGVAVPCHCCGLSQSQVAGAALAGAFPSSLEAHKAKSKSVSRTPRGASSKRESASTDHYSHLFFTRPKEVPAEEDDGPPAPKPWGYHHVPDGDTLVRVPHTSEWKTVWEMLAPLYPTPPTDQDIDAFCLWFRRKREKHPNLDPAFESERWLARIDHVTSQPGRKDFLMRYIKKLLKEERVPKHADF